MELTLDQFLEEIDRWKRAVTERTRHLSPEQLKERDQKAQKWLESQLGFSLPQELAESDRKP